MTVERAALLPLGGPGQVFDPVGIPFNGPRAPAARTSYAHRLPPSSVPVPLPPWIPTTRRDFAVPSDVSSTPIHVVAPTPITAYTPYVGGFSGVRAAQVMHQHDIKFWTEGGVVDVVMKSKQPDPSSAEIDQMYADLQLFSYMPTGMLPTAAEFADQVTPSRRTLAAKRDLRKAGIFASNTNNAASAASISNTDTVGLPTLIGQPPFADRLTDWCAMRNYIKQTNWF